MEILEDRQQWEAEFKQNWLSHFQKTGETDWARYNHPTNQIAPSGSGLDLAESRVLLISSAGSYWIGNQPPFDADNPLGDYSLRTYPIDTPFRELAFAHTHYDHAAVDEDPQVLLPLTHLQDMVEEGKIGELAPEVISFMGYQPVVTRVLDETFPEILRQAQRLEATAGLLVPA